MTVSRKDLALQEVEKGNLTIIETGFESDCCKTCEEPYSQTWDSDLQALVFVCIHCEENEN